MKTKKNDNVFLSKKDLDKKSYKIIVLRVNSILYYQLLLKIKRHYNSNNSKIISFYYINDKLKYLFDNLYMLLSDINCKDAFDMGRNNYENVSNYIIKALTYGKTNKEKKKILLNNNYSNFYFKKDKRSRMKITMENYRKLNRFCGIFNIERNDFLNLILNIIL